MLCLLITSEPAGGAADEPVDGAEATEPTKKKKKKKKKAGGSEEDYLHPPSNPTGGIKCIEVNISPTVCSLVYNYFTGDIV